MEAPQIRQVPSTARLIAIEGIDGSGKTSLSKALQPLIFASIERRLAELASNARSVEVVTPWEAHGWTKDVRQFFVDGIGDNLTEMLLTTACRRELVRTKIDPMLREGSFVIVDRFIATTMAYQCELSDDLRIALDLFRDFVYRMIPGLTLYLDVPYVDALARASDRGKMDSIEQRGELFHEGLDVKFRLAFAVLASISNAYAVRIDASQPFDEVVAESMRVIEWYLDVLFSVGQERDTATAELKARNITSMEYVNAGP